MRLLLILLASVMLVMTAWGGAAQVASPDCLETAEQMAVHVTGDCDGVPANSDRNYPHCHTGCHGHHVTAPMPARAIGQASAILRVYAHAAQPTLTGHQVDRTLRPPQA